MNKVEDMSKEEFYSIFNQETFDNFFAKEKIIWIDYIENLIKKLWINKLTDDKWYNINALYICDIIKILEHLQDTTEEKRDDDEMKSEMESAIQDWIHITEDRDHRYKICRYFDDVYEADMEINLTKEQADEHIKRYKNWAYVSYEIQKD